jgi:hypothetical protein
MDGSSLQEADGSAFGSRVRQNADGPATFPRILANAATDSGAGSRLWLLVLLGLLAWQGWMTLTLFGPGDYFARLLDDQPIVSGQHPLHFYHGLRGARSFLDNGTLCCYDPAFQAGYPKTPVFDSGSRPAELFLALGGATYKPALYKVGLAVCCLLVPGLLFLAARGAGLGRGPACLAVALGLLVWWGTPCREALEAGDLDVLLAGLAALAFCGSLISFHHAPGARAWFGLLATGSLAWFADPFLFLLLVPVLLVYYISVGVRHRLGWHLALLASLVAAVAANSFWLIDWTTSWWLRLPLQLDSSALVHRTFHTFWNAALWGEPADRALAVALVGLGAIGVCILNQTNERPAARLLGLGAGGFLLLAVLGIAWEPLGRLGTSRLLVPALWFAAVPAAFTLGQVVQGVGARGEGRRASGPASLLPRPSSLIPVLALLAVGATGHQFVTDLAARCTRTTPFEIGLGADRQAVVESLHNYTDAQARILWEETRAGISDFGCGISDLKPEIRHRKSGWTALLPLLTDRAYIGGLGPDLCIEHGYPTLVDGTLAGQPLADWSDADLEAFCRHYNVGWAVCTSSAAVARFRAWKDARETTTWDGEVTGTLFTLNPRSFLLKGRARLLSADRRCLTLADVNPEDGVLILSLHYHAGMRASPGRVQVEREPDSHDPISFIRLRVAGPVARVTLSFGK